MDALTSPPLPPKAITMLAELGLTSRDALVACGAVRAFLLLKAAGLTATERLLFALEAAARGVHWNQLSDPDRIRLKASLAEHPPVRLPPPAEARVRFMREAQTLAGHAAENGEVPVGAVVVYRGEIVGRGFNQPIARHDPSAHAEMVALREAAATLDNYRLSGCDLYVTLEPCPMCAGAILHARLDRVLYGAADPKTGAAGSRVDLFGVKALNPHTAVFAGIEDEACATQLSDFFRRRREEDKTA
ncbi:tRNA adenosine(34) deaminase TadA [Crenobacter cavernae]|uniref:tRNA-specific adenosine deaminase n=1 Tax=Crenobacter cavernae TaxID=2290923 RepID=A0A345Y6Q0_9NEIS|nr:tRNA adenosine(34) deaminase TadA [Crenobacter cavernae]AXK39602.1 tRNA adenosine(34) deaminase TadA [Crenobacter cavernae]